MTPRLYLNESLVAQTDIAVANSHLHYLRNVLRRDVGDEVRLFNGVDGEFSGRIVALSKKAATITLDRQSRPQSSEPDLHLLFAPVKRGAVEMIVQKSVELGVSRLQPVVTQYTNVSRLNHERLQMIAIEAAEQSERLSVPCVEPTEGLESILAGLEPARRVMFCDEAGDDPDAPWGGTTGRAAPVLLALRAIEKPSSEKTEPWAILIGPEGGFSEEERAMLRERDGVVPVTLGPRILRADTAALAAITLWQSLLGDWRGRSAGEVTDA